MHTKILIRSLTFNLRYQQWIEKHRPIHVEMLRGSYANEVFGLGSSDLHYETSNASSRIIWSPGVLEIEHLDFMMEHFVCILLKNNYCKVLSDERNEVFDKGLKLTIQRHHLKSGEAPGEQGENNPTNKFGNIRIEHRFNSVHNTLCISANYNGEKRYQSFEKLMEILLE